MGPEQPVQIPPSPPPATSVRLFPVSRPLGERFGAAARDVGLWLERYPELLVELDVDTVVGLTQVASGVRVELMQQVARRVGQGDRPRRVARALTSAVAGEAAARR